MNVGENIKCVIILLSRSQRASKEFIFRITSNNITIRNSSSISHLQDLSTILPLRSWGNLLHQEHQPTAILPAMALMVTPMAVAVPIIQVLLLMTEAAIRLLRNRQLLQRTSQPRASRDSNLWSIRFLPPCPKTTAACSWGPEPAATPILRDQ